MRIMIIRSIITTIRVTITIIARSIIRRINMTRIANDYYYYQDYY